MNFATPVSKTRCAVDLRDRDSLAAESLGPFRQRIGLRAGQLRAAGDDDALHHRRVLEDPEIGLSARCP